MKVPIINAELKLFVFTIGNDFYQLCFFGPKLLIYQGLGKDTKWYIRISSCWLFDLWVWPELNGKWSIHLLFNLVYFGKHSQTGRFFAKVNLEKTRMP